MVSRAESIIIYFQCTSTDNQLYLYSKLKNLSKSQTFEPDWSELGFIRAK